MFSAEQAGEATFVRAHVLMRANDPLYELGMTFGGHAKEDRFWAQTMTALGTRLGVLDPQVETRSTCVEAIGSGGTPRTAGTTPCCAARCRPWLPR